MKADIISNQIVFYPTTGAEEVGIRGFLKSLVDKETISEYECKRDFRVSINIIKDLELELDD